MQCKLVVVPEWQRIFPDLSKQAPEVRISFSLFQAWFEDMILLKNMYKILPTDMSSKQDSAKVWSLIIEAV